MVDFDKGIARDDIMYRGLSCSDSLYDPAKHLNLNHKKEVGILQFARIGNNRGDDEKRLRKLQEFQKQKDIVSDILKDDFKGGKSTSKSQGNLTSKKGEKPPPRDSKKAVDFQGNPIMTGVDYRNSSLHYNRGIGLSQQYGRMAEKSNYLPVHLQNHHGRLAMTQKTYTSLVSNNEKERGFLDPVSTLNTRKEFWVDPKKVKT